MRRTSIVMALFALHWMGATSASAQDTADRVAPGEAQVGPEEEAPPPDVTAPQQPVPPVEPTPSAAEDCANRRDDDGDELVDCGDADCFDVPTCEAGGSEERNDQRCSDWIDNDGDGTTDCDDQDCSGPGIQACTGSLDPRTQGPRLTGDTQPEDMIGEHGDADGERNDELCSDGYDNDRDGKVDCEDFGCRYDPSVSVCLGDGGIRFSVVAGVGAAYDFEAPEGDNGWDVRFTRLQLRALGSIPFLENSFFLLNLRAERTPRLTFALFQVPIDDDGHYIAINSGGGNLSSGLIVSAAKQPLLDPPFYLFNAFEQGNGAVLELGGPITQDNSLRFRAFVAGGSGEFNGNVGGRFFRSDERNFSWSAGGQLGINLVGYFDRFDSAYVYTPVPLTIGLVVGAKYDQRPRERYPAANAFAILRYSHLQLRVENYTKYVLDFGGAIQTAWNAQVSLLLVPRLFMLAADIGQFYAGRFQETPDFDSELRRPIDELVFRAALHWFFYRNIGLLSLLYREGHLEENPDRPEDPTLERELRLEAQFRF